MASRDRVGWRATVAGHVEDLAGNVGTSTGLVKVETVRGTGALRRVTGGVRNGTITLAMVGAGTQEAMRFSLTRKGDGLQLQIY